MHNRIITSLSDLPTRLPGLISTDLETHDPGLKLRGPGWCFPEPDGFILGYGVYTPEFSCYVPVAHPEGNVDPAKAAEWYKEVVAEAPNDKVAANAAYEMGWSRTVGIKRWNGKVHDVLVQAPLINEHRFSYDLDALAKEKLPDSPGKDKELLVEEASKLGIRPKDIMANLRRFSAHSVGTYCIQDCRITYDLYEAQIEDVVTHSSQRIYDMEIELIPLLVEMRSRGVRVNVDEGAKVADTLDRYQRLLLSKINHMVGVRVDNPFDNDQLQQVFQSIGVELPRTPKTNKPSVDKDWLEVQAHPVAKVVRRVRQVHVTNRDYVKRDIVNNSVQGRLYGQFNPLKSDEGGTISGRFSSSKPNLQQIPGRDKVLSPLVRGLYLPEEGCFWGAFDYSQQEPRGMTAMAFRAGLPSAAPWRRKYIEDINTDFHTMAAEFTGLPRDDAKNLGLGIAYSMGGGKLCLKLGLPTVWKTFTDRKTGQPVTYLAAGPEGEKIMRQFDSAAGFIRELSKMCSKMAKTRGWIITPLGRKFHYPFKNGEHFKAHKALNSLIQGMSADQTKMSMLMMWREGLIPALTVHDEVDFANLENAESGRRIVEIMMSSMPLPVPALVDFDLGSSWGDAKKHPIKLEGLPVVYTDK
jgi:DNA polymerase I-like protein with 3'-5' exonuclease and polymerase domains